MTQNNSAGVDAYFAAIAANGWAGATPQAAAVLGDGDLAVLLADTGDRWDALVAFGRRLDLTALGEAEAGTLLSVRERLFDLMMARFDAMQAYRPAIARLAAAAPRDIGLILLFGRELPQSIRRIAEAAGVDTGGLLGPLRVQALTSMYLSVARTWLHDDEPDLARTMRVLDEALGRAERVARLSLRRDEDRARSADPLPE